MDGLSSAISLSNRPVRGSSTLSTASLRASDFPRTSSKLAPSICGCPWSFQVSSKLSTSIEYPSPRTSLKSSAPIDCPLLRIDSKLAPSIRSRFLRISLGLSTSIDGLMLRTSSKLAPSIRAWLSSFRVSSKLSTSIEYPLSRTGLKLASSIHGWLFRTSPKLASSIQGWLSRTSSKLILLCMVLRPALFIRYDVDGGEV